MGLNVGRVGVKLCGMWKDPVIEAYKPGVDRTLLAENLKLTVDQRFQRLMELQRFAEELQRAGREAREKAKR